MLRHSRAMARHHRERVIKRRQKLFDVIWHGGYQDTPGTLAKFSAHHHECYFCKQRFNRNAEKQRYGKLSQKT